MRPSFTEPDLLDVLFALYPGTKLDLITGRRAISGKVIWYLGHPIIDTNAPAFFGMDLASDFSAALARKVDAEITKGNQ